MEDFLVQLLIKGGMPLALLILGWLAGRYIKPWIHAKPSRLETANEFALIADRITDELTLQFPSAQWDDWIDQAVDKFISSCGLTDADDHKALAHREIASQIVKKGLAGPLKPKIA